MSFWNSRQYKAKKIHHCEYCGKEIAVGEAYFRETGIYEGDFNDYCLCARCRECLNSLKEGSWDYELGYLLDDLRDCYMLECSHCGYNPTECDFTDDMMAVNCECDCGNKYTVSITAEDIQKYLDNRQL